VAEECGAGRGLLRGGGGGGEALASGFGPSFRAPVLSTFWGAFVADATAFACCVLRAASGMRL
jgi:hypothetical protein